MSEEIKEVANVSANAEVKEVQPVTTEEKSEVKTEEVQSVTEYEPDATLPLEKQLEELNKLRGKWANEVGSMRKEKELLKKQVELLSPKAEVKEEKRESIAVLPTPEEIAKAIEVDPAQGIHGLLKQTLDVAEKRAEQRFNRLQAERKMDEALLTRFPEVAKNDSALRKETIKVIQEGGFSPEQTLLAAELADLRLKNKDMQTQITGLKANTVVTTKISANHVSNPGTSVTTEVNLTPEELAFCKKTGLDQKGFAELKKKGK
ncbi:MAG: hypothetical protein WC810_24640 [Janthinobacterium sp.]|jgi:hypothetical protein